MKEERRLDKEKHDKIGKYKRKIETELEDKKKKESEEALKYKVDKAVYIRVK